MQLGITIPLQKYLNLPKQSYGEPEDVFLLGNPPDPLSADEPGYLFGTAGIFQEGHGSYWNYFSF